MMAAQRGFTLPELVAVLVVASVVATAVMPRLDAGLAVRSDGWHDELSSGLRLAHATAQSHRRLVCANIGNSSMTLAIAAANPAMSCGAALSGPDGAVAYTSNSIGAVASVSPAGTMYFQPSGRVTSDGAGSIVSGRSITVSGSDTIVLDGESGHVQ